MNSSESGAGSGRTASERQAMRNTLEREISAAASRGHRLVMAVLPPSPRHSALLGKVLGELLGEALVQPCPRAGADATDQLQALLGSERQHVQFRLPELPGDELDAGLLAAAGGTLRAGGVLHLCPSARSTDPFGKRLLTALQAHGRAFSNVDPSELPQARRASCYLLERLNPDHESPGVGDARSDPVAEEAAPQKRAWLDEQDRLLDAIVEDFMKRATRAASNAEPGAAVVNGRRGRGKSGLLGRLGARLAARGLTARVVAEQPGALATIRRHWFAEREGLSLPAEELPRLSLQVALQSRGDCLLVDEAAAIPLPILVRLAERFEQLVLVTTNEGYEGTGRGFALRLATALTRIDRKTRHYRLTRPVRWAIGDPLEALLDHALLLDVPPATPDCGHRYSGDPDELHVRRVDRTALCEDETRLRRFAALLMQAHYRTSLQDLRHLLPHSPLQLYELVHSDEVVAMALIAREGELPASTHVPIRTRQRRLPDQVLPQLLAQCLDDSAPLVLRYARVVRIAVVPALQGRGLGSHLINALAEALHCTTDVFGASFGADARLLRFWLKHEFVPTHRGLRRNARSGLRSVCVLKALHPPAEEPVDSAGTLLRMNLAALRSSHQPCPGNSIEAGQDRTAEPGGNTELERLLLPAADAVLPDAERFPDRRLLAQLNQFANRQRSAIDSAAALRLWALHLPRDEADRLGIDLDAWFAKLLGGGHGRRTREQDLRNLVAATLPADCQRGPPATAAQVDQRTFGDERDPNEHQQASKRSDGT